MKKFFYDNHMIRENNVSFKEKIKVDREACKIELIAAK